MMDKDTKDFLITTGSIALGVIILKALFGDKKYFKCPRCNFPVDSSMHSCPNCGQILKWN